jgi:Delta3-Delta2-enoyl-CoA isomerase
LIHPTHRCQSLSLAIQTAEKEKNIQSLILQSNNPSIFSAGLDLTELHQPAPDRLRAFWSSFQQLYLDLYGSRLACIAAIEGHAPAAGCMLALSCDYRIMLSGTSAKIGLNESQLGIAAPPWLAQQMVDTVGRRRAEMAMSLGLLYTAEEALEMELVDLVVEKDQVRERALQVAIQWRQIPAVARVANKMFIRKRRLDELLATRNDDLDSFCSFVTTGNVQRSLTAYLDMLAKKSNKR